MLGTIMIGKYMSVQGIIVGYRPNGQMGVRVGNRIYYGDPVSRTQAA